MKRKILFLVLLSFLATSLTITPGNSQPDTLIESSCLIYPVVLDGQITSPSEWSDTSFVDMQWGLGIPPSSPWINARIWSKNDGEWLYFLYRVQWPSGDIDDYDGAQIGYYWGHYGPPWDDSDLTYVGYDGDTLDAYGWDETQFYDDTTAIPPGENNIQGAATHDGTYYWFEFRKLISSGDGYDWPFQVGETYGLMIDETEEGGNLLVGLWDNSIENEYHEHARLHIYKCPPVGGEILPFSWIRVMTPYAIMVLSAVAVLASMKSRKTSKIHPI